MQKPTWWSRQLSVPTIGRTCSDQRHPGLECAPADGQVADRDDVHAAALEDPHLVRIVEVLLTGVGHAGLPRGRDWYGSKDRGVVAGELRKLARLAARESAHGVRRRCEGSLADQAEEAVEMLDEPVR